VSCSGLFPASPQNPSRSLHDLLPCFAPKANILRISPVVTAGSLPRVLYDTETPLPTPHPRSHHRSPPPSPRHPPPPGCRPKWMRLKKAERNRSCMCGGLVGRGPRALRAGLLVGLAAEAERDVGEDVPASWAQDALPDRDTLERRHRVGRSSEASWEGACTAWGPSWEASWARRMQIRNTDNHPPLKSPLSLGWRRGMP